MKGLLQDLYGVEAADLATLATVSVLLLAVALVACWVPARHCAAVDPMQACEMSSQTFFGGEMREKQ